MDLEVLQKGFSEAVPSYFAPYAAEVDEAYADLPFCPDAELDAAWKALKTVDFPQACINFLREENAALHRDKVKNRSARFLRYVMIEKRHPWDYGMSADNHPVQVEGYPPESFELLLVITLLGYTMTAGRKPPQERNVENLKSILSFTNQFYNANGVWGIKLWIWSFVCAGGCMFPFHTLKFHPAHFDSAFLVLKRGKEYRTLLRAEWQVAADGTAVSPDEPFAVVTSYREDDTSWTAHIVSPVDGKISLQPQTVSKAEWSVYMTGEDYVLSYHIPENSEYTPEQHRISMMQALAFYREYYPQIDWKGFFCSSWLYSPQNAALFAPGSRVLEMQKYVHTFPARRKIDQNIKFLREGTALYDRVCTYLNAGNRWYIGRCYVPTDEAAAFGEKPVV